MKIQIESVENGLILTDIEGEILDGVKKETKYVFNFSDISFDVRSDQNALIDLLFKVGSYAGFTYDKYSETNLNINFEKKGHKLS